MLPAQVEKLMHKPSFSMMAKIYMFMKPHFFGAIVRLFVWEVDTGDAKIFVIFVGSIIFLFKVGIQA